MTDKSYYAPFFKHFSLSFFVFVLGVFQKHLVDGPLLLRLDELFARDTLGLSHALQRRKLVRAVEQLKKNQVRHFKVRWCCFDLFIMFFSEDILFLTNCFMSCLL